MFQANKLCAAGRFANSSSCVRCELCVNHVPEIFRLDETGKAYINVQPTDPKQLRRVLECVETCPIRGILDRDA